MDYANQPCTECNWVTTGNYTIDEYLQNQGVGNYTWQKAEDAFYESRLVEKLELMPGVRSFGAFAELAITKADEIVGVRLYQLGLNQTEPYIAFGYVCHGTCGFGEGLTPVGKVILFGGLSLVGGAVGKLTYDRSRGHGHKGSMVGAVFGLATGIVAELLRNKGMW